MTAKKPKKIDEQPKEVEEICIISIAIARTGSIYGVDKNSKVYFYNDINKQWVLL